MHSILARRLVGKWVTWRCAINPSLPRQGILRYVKNGHIVMEEVYRSGARSSFGGWLPNLTDLRPMTEEEIQNFTNTNNPPTQPTP